MKTTKHFSLVLIAGLAFSIVLSSCENNSEVKPQDDILPKSFSVTIPSSMTSQNTTGGRIDGRTKSDTLQGNEAYLNLGTFIAVGHEASKIVQGFIDGIRKYHIDRVLTLTFKGDDDGRIKNLVVLSQVSYEGQTWDYELTVTDADSEGQADGGKAIQLFWNKNSPIKGIAIIKPYNCDRIKNANASEAIFRIDYSELGSTGYDAQMEVRIAGLPTGNPLNNTYAINNLKMFVGKKGDIVDVYGNSNHPNAKFFTNAIGFNWAFVASGNDAKDVAVAEVGLPPSALDNGDRNVLLKEYSIKNVFTTQITTVWPAIDQDVLAAYLSNTAAPGYFGSKGFISGGTSPGTEWTTLALRLNNLSPYNPKDISALTVTFK